MKSPASATPAPAEQTLDDPVYRSLLGSLAELKTCYDEGFEPPIFEELDSLTAARAYEQIRLRLPHIWNDLVKYHRKNGLRIRREVTSTFNTMMSLVKKRSEDAAGD